MAATGASRRRLVVRHPADPVHLSVLRRRVNRWATENTMPAEALADLQLALGEAVSNGIEHAYREGDPGTVQVKLELRLADGVPVVAVEVTDRGRWRPVPFQKGYRGRGLAIIEQLSRGLRIRTSQQGTRLTFAVPVGG